MSWIILKHVGIYEISKTLTYQGGFGQNVMNTVLSVVARHTRFANMVEVPNRTIDERATGKEVEVAKLRITQFDKILTK